MVIASTTIPLNMARKFTQVVALRVTVNGLVMTERRRHQLLRRIELHSQSHQKHTVSMILTEPLAYIWTGGHRTGKRNFAWYNGERFTISEWSHTGA
ncbi:hypothetical protein Hamer_G028282, partial [Homarus americanus]